MRRATCVACGYSIDVTADRGMVELDERTIDASSAGPTPSFLHSGWVVF